MLSFTSSTFSYGKNRPEAVNDATGAWGPGIHLLAGENGAGKTTLMQLCAGLLRARSGQVCVDGHDVWPRRPLTLERTFMLAADFESPTPTIMELARTHGALYPAMSYDMLEANLDDFGLTGRERLSELSLGLRRKSYMAYALALGVDNLLLDEPANGMDPGSKDTLRRLLGRCVADHQTVVIATHNLLDMDTLFDSVTIMRAGRVKLSMPLWQLTERVAFVTADSAVDGAIYQQPVAGRFHAIIPNTDALETQAELPLLYAAVMAPVGDMMVDFINRFNPSRP